MAENMLKCHVCGGSPNNKVKLKSVAKLFRCDACKTISCNNHLKIGLMQMVCPKCKSPKLRIAAESKPGVGITWGKKQGEGQKSGSNRPQPQTKVKQGNSGSGGRAGSSSSHHTSTSSSTQGLTGFGSDDAGLIKNETIRQFTNQIKSSVLGNVIKSDLKPLTKEVEDKTQKSSDNQSENSHKSADNVSSNESDSHSVDTSQAGDQVDCAHDSTEELDILDACCLIQAPRDWEFYCEWKQPLSNETQSSLICANAAIEQGTLVTKVSSELSDYSRLACGIHPHSLNALTKKDIREVLEVMQQSRPLALGVVGLDFAHNSTNKTQQIETLVEQLRLDEFVNLPVILHLKGVISPEDLPKELKQRFVALHAPDLTPDAYQFAQEAGWWLIALPAATYPEREAYQSALKGWPYDKLLIASGSRLLAPKSMAGAFNSPEYIYETLAWLSAHRGQPVEKLEDQLKQNLKELLTS